MQTIDRPSSPPGTQPPRRGPSPVLVAVGAVVALAVLVLLILSKWGVLIAVVLGCVAALGIWVLRKGFLVIEVIAFLIHFDGVGVGPVRIGRIIAVLAVVLIAYKLLVERWRPPAIPTRHWLPVMLLIVWAVLSAAWVDSIGAWFFAAGLLGLAVAYYGISALLVDSHEKIMRFLRAYWVGGLFGSGAGVLALFLGTRSVGFGGDPNFFGLLQATMIPLTVHYRRNARTVAQKGWYTVALVFVCAGAAGAGSRSGLIGAAVAIVGTMVTRPGLSGRGRIRVALGAVVVAALAFAIGFVANPYNLSRGFSDRGAGRLDFWTATIPLIEDRPILGHGLGQLSKKILPSLTTSPGVEQLTDTREEVSAHNTLLDILGDLGLVGAAIWGVIFVVAEVGFLRPRWRRTKEISTTLFVMTLPMITGAMFLPLTNQKVVISMIGLSSALQVPSKRTRWRGFNEPLPIQDGPVRAGAGTSRSDLPVRWTTERSAPASPEEWDTCALARWDARSSRRSRLAVVASGVVGMSIFWAASSFAPQQWIASTDVVLVDLSATRGADRVVVDLTENQVLDSIVTSGAYAQTLRDSAGLDLSTPEVRDHVVTTREGFGSFMTIAFRSTDRRLVEQARPHVLAALEETIAASRAASSAQMADELRPVFPGEQRYDTSALYLPVGSEPVLTRDDPSRVWIALVGLVFGILCSSTLVLLQQRKPRVNAEDDLRASIGLDVWAHVGDTRRRGGSVQGQYANLLMMVSDSVARDGGPRRIVVATPGPDRAARTLVTGIAACIAADGGRVVLVDAQSDSPRLSTRLAGPLRRGLVEVLEGASVEPLLRRVRPWRLPTPARRVVGSHADRIHFLALGRRRRGPAPVFDGNRLDVVGDDATILVLAPSMTSGAPVREVLAWADVVLLSVVEGRTVTFDAEDAAAPVRTFVARRSGVVIMDV